MMKSQTKNLHMAAPNRRGTELFFVAICINSSASLLLRRSSFQRR